MDSDSREAFPVVFRSLGGSDHEKPTRSLGLGSELGGIGFGRPEVAKSGREGGFEGRRQTTFLAVSDAS